MTIQKIKMRGNNAVPLVVIVFSLLLLGWKFGGPLLQSAGAPEALVALRQRAAVAQRRLQQETRIRERNVKLRSTAAAWESRFYRMSPENAIVELVSTLDRLAGISGLPVEEKRLHRQLPAPAGWDKIGITLSGRARFSELTGFLNEILLLEKIIMVENAHFFADKRTGLLSYQITLTTLTGQAKGNK